MTRKRQFIIIGIFGGILPLIGLILYQYQHKEPIPTTGRVNQDIIDYFRSRIPNEMVGRMYSVRDRIIQFYEQSLNQDPSQVSSDFAEYITNRVPGFFHLEPPPIGRATFLDSTYYLCLPKNLQSDSSKVVAYSNPYQDQAGEYYRVILVLDGIELKVLDQQQDIADKAIGEAVFNNAQPSFYGWEPSWYYMMYEYKPAKSKK